jgi:hypothetical protein
MGRDIKGWTDAPWPAPVLFSDVPHVLLLEFPTNWTLLIYILKEKPNSETAVEFFSTAHRTYPVSSLYLTACPNPWAQLRPH